MPERWSQESGPYPEKGIDAVDTQVIGSSTLYNNGGQIRYVPMPTPNPKDPLNLPVWRKWVAIGSLCFFGALALAAETIVGALVPVFVLEYSGIDPKLLGQIDISALFPPGEVQVNPVSVLAGLGGPPIWKVTLLSTLPLLVNGIASYILVPLSLAIGRRPIILLSGVMAFTGGLWAGFSQSLDSHLAARCFQGFGAGAVEALIPLIIQDMMFIHQRNTAVSLINASQGLIVVALGINSPLIVTRLSWRFVYWITSGTGLLAFIFIILFVPETRWVRSQAELAGKEVFPLRLGETRPRLDYSRYGYRTNWDDFGIPTDNFQWRLAAQSLIETAKSTVFPNVIWVLLLQSVFVGATFAAATTGSSVLIAAGWKFEHLGLAVLPVVAATPFVWLFGGLFADKISNAHARRHGGQREPEAHLLSLIVPLIAGIAGPLTFGLAAANIRTVPSIVILIGVFLIGFGGLTINTVVNVYLVESYPNYAGPILTTVSSMRLIAAFGLTLKSTDWIEQIGFLRTFAIYSGIMVGIGLFLPVFYVYGKRVREWTAGRLESVPDMDANRSVTGFSHEKTNSVEMKSVDDDTNLWGSRESDDMVRHKRRDYYVVGMRDRKR